MIFYIQPKGIQILQYVSTKGQFIGTLNINDADTKKLVKDDISIQKIQENLKQKKYLISVIFYNTWQICILANTSDGFNEIKSKYKQCQMIWYWLQEQYIKECLPSIQFKEFKKIFK